MKKLVLMLLVLTLLPLGSLAETLHYGSEDETAAVLAEAAAAAASMDAAGEESSVKALDALLADKNGAVLAGSGAVIEAMAKLSP